MPTRGIRPKCACLWLQIKVRHFYQTVPAKQAFFKMCLQNNLVDCTDFGGLHAAAQYRQYELRSRHYLFQLLPASAGIASKYEITDLRNADKF